MALTVSNTLRLIISDVVPYFQYTFLNSVSETIDKINTKTLVPPSESFDNYGCLIIHSRRDSHFYLIYKDESSKLQYIQYSKFSLLIKPLNDGIFDILKIGSIVKYLNENSFEKLTNIYPNKIKCVSNPSGPNDFLLMYKIEMKENSKIYTNTSLNSLPRNESEPSYYTFVLDEFGIHYGFYENVLEMGTAHQFLINTDSTNVFIAGEIKIENQSVTFNFMSGTFSARLNLDKKPILKKLFIEILTIIFNLHNNDLKTRITSISYTDAILFDKIKPSNKSIRQMCLQPYTQNNVVVLDEGVRCVNSSLKDITAEQNRKAQSDLLTGKNLLCQDKNYQYESKYQKYKNKYLNLKKRLEN